MTYDRRQLEHIKAALALLYGPAPSEAELADIAVRLGRPDLIPEHPSLPLEARE